MHEIDLKKYNIRSDLIIENNANDYIDDTYTKNNIKVDYIKLLESNPLNKKKGDYITITFQDVTDSTNFKNVLEIFKDELKRIFKLTKIKKDATCLIIGLGNKNSTPDALGYETLKNITVTRHLYKIGEVDLKYKNISILEPNVFGNTGIESKEIIEGVIEKVKPDLLIIIDSLAASSVDRLQKTIQITNTGIEPGSGIGNKRSELSKDNLNIPVIAIGVPTVITSSSIVFDTINFLLKKISYHKHDYKKDKLIPNYNLNYLTEKNKLTKEEKQNLLGLLGSLDDQELKELFNEVLSPIGYNLIVTTKEIDFIIEKLGKLLATGLNNCLHNEI